MPDIYVEYRCGKSRELISIKTKLEWVLFGGIGCHKYTVINNLSASPKETLTNLVEKF